MIYNDNTKLLSRPIQNVKNIAIKIHEKSKNAASIQA